MGIRGRAACTVDARMRVTTVKMREVEVEVEEWGILVL